MFSCQVSNCQNSITEENAVWCDQHFKLFIRCWTDSKFYFVPDYQLFKIIGITTKNIYEM